MRVSTLSMKPELKCGRFLLPKGRARQVGEEVVSHGAVIHCVAFQARDELLVERERWREEHIVKVTLNGRYQIKAERERESSQG